MMFTVDGITYLVESGENIKPGDQYLAKGHFGWKLLECREHNREEGTIVAKTEDNEYKTRQCCKVIEVLSDTARDETKVRVG